MYMLELTKDLYIGSGCHQSVYMHPCNKNLCVKILTDTDPVIIKEEQRNRTRESSYLARVDSRTPGCPCLVHFVGIEDTNMGEGAVYTLVRDADGTISISLEDYLCTLLEHKNDFTLFTSEVNDLYSALVRFRINMLENKIVTRNIRPVNICVQKNENNCIENLVLIDDLGPTELIPITEYVSFLAISRVKRKWKKFISLLRSYCDEKEFQEMLDKLIKE